MRRPITLCLLVLSSVAGAQPADNPYTDKYGSKTVRLLQAERAFAAGFNWGRQDSDVESVDATKPAPRADGGFKELGSTNGITSQATQALGSGQETLSEAISKIMPNGCWKARIDESLMDIQVSWKGDRSWVDVVTDLARGNGFYAYLNEKDCILYLSELPYVEGDDITGDMTWYLPKGKRLSVVLSDWAKKAGWSLEWGPYPKDTIIDHPATLTGPFAGEEGVIAQVIDAYENTRFPLQYEFNHGNNVVIIREKKYTTKLNSR